MVVAPWLAVSRPPPRLGDASRRIAPDRLIGDATRTPRISARAARLEARRWRIASHRRKDPVAAQAREPVSDPAPVEDRIRVRRPAQAPNCLPSEFRPTTSCRPCRWPQRRCPARQARARRFPGSTAANFSYSRQNAFGGCWRSSASMPPAAATSRYAAPVTAGRGKPPARCSAGHCRRVMPTSATSRPTSTLGSRHTGVGGRQPQSVNPADVARGEQTRTGRPIGRPASCRVLSTVACPRSLRRDRDKRAHPPQSAPG